MSNLLKSLLYTSILISLSSCNSFNDKAPLCSDSRTLELVREIIIKSILEIDPLVEPSKKERLTFEYAHATKLDENINRYSCEADLIIDGNKSHKIKISYMSQLDDKSDHLVETAGINLLEAAYIKDTLLISKDIHSEIQDNIDPAKDNQDLVSQEQLKQNKDNRDAVLNGFSPSKAYPRFVDYPAIEKYTGEAAELDLSSEAARMFKTRLTEALKTNEIISAGEYVTASWGCGTSCSYTTFINKRTGKVVEDGIGGESGQRIVGLDISSDLIIAEGAELDNDYNRVGYYAYFFILKDEKLKLLKKIPIEPPLEEENY